MPVFDPEVTYENPQWWDEVRYLEDDPWFVQVLDAGAEVARVELVEDGGVNPTYVGVPVIGAERLMIHLIEVATAARRRGIGTQVVLGLAERHPTRRLFAYSEGADDFWESLGWDRFTDPKKRSRPLFIQPAR
ncbi:acetyltransferase, gnat family protein [Mycobacteroides abscessus subsp. abscessus]|nr:acetyltransferase, gnat family protein [Mycobacteroides abscessus subsp. abscessus]